MCNFRVHRKKIIFSREQTSETMRMALGTAAAEVSVNNCGLPFVTFLTLPPDLFLAAG